MHSNYERLAKLRQNRSVPEKTFDEISTQLKITEANLRSAQENLRKVRSIFWNEEIIQARANYQKAKAFSQLVKKTFQIVI